MDESTTETAPLGAAQVSQEQRSKKKSNATIAVLLEPNAYLPTIEHAAKLREKVPVPHRVLPPQPSAFKGRKCLVLDLDETLVHSSTKLSDGAKPDFSVPVVIEARQQQVHVMKRPGCQRFLEHVAQKFEVVVFTASLARYADAVLDVIDPKGLIWWRLYRDSCTSGLGRIKGQYVKDLSALGRTSTGAVLLDNSPSCYCLQPNQGIPIANFFDDPDDNHLLELLPKLDELADCDNVEEFVALTWPKIPGKDNFLQSPLSSPRRVGEEQPGDDCPPRGRRGSLISTDMSSAIMTTQRLHAAVIAGDEDLVHALIASNVNVNSDLNGMSVLQRAAFGGHTLVVKALFQANAHVDSQMECVKQALAWASLDAPCYSYDPDVLETSDGDRTSIISDRCRVVSAIKAMEEKYGDPSKRTPKATAKASASHPLIKRRSATPPLSGGPCSSACAVS